VLDVKTTWGYKTWLTSEGTLWDSLVEKKYWWRFFLPLLCKWIKNLIITKIPFYRVFDSHRIFVNGIGGRWIDDSREVDEWCFDVQREIYCEFRW
jgi:hypothetical protein